MLNLFLRKKYIHAERSSVCFGDDCNAPNAEELPYTKDMKLSSFLWTVEKYVPHFSPEQHTIWAIENLSEPIAFLESDRTHSYACTPVNNIMVKDIKEQRIFCRYFYAYRGRLCSELNNFVTPEWEAAHPESVTLLDYVKAYYDLPVEDRRG